jgi:hypothetical protein
LGREDEMIDRRNFNSMLLAGSAAAATGDARAEGTSAVAGSSGFDALRLPETYRPVFEQSYPRFSDAEYKRRQEVMAQKMAAAGLDYVLMVTNTWVGNANVWMTGWRGTSECLTLFKPGEQMVMWVEYYNHLPQCREVAKGIDVRWGQEKGAQLVAEELAKRGAKKVGVIGPLNGAAWKGIETKVPLVPLGREYIELRLIKSEEEIQWMRIGGALSDLDAVDGSSTRHASALDVGAAKAPTIQRSYPCRRSRQSVSISPSRSSRSTELMLPVRSSSAAS